MKLRYGYWLLLLPLFGCGQSDEAPVFVDLGTVSDCDVSRQSCTVTENALSLSLALGPDVVPLKPFAVRFQSDGASAIDKDSVVVDFQMQGMDMGVNRYRLKQDDDSYWRATATLPVCTVSRMEWMAVVEFAQGGEHYRLRFPFAVEAN